MITTPLMKHQRQGLQWLLERDQGALFWKMGTGKSLTALAYADAIGAKRVLITSDKNNILNTWADQVYQHTDYDCVVRPTTRRLSTSYTNWNDHECVCVNYELLAKQWKLYCRFPWDIWIGDESSEFKCPWTDKHRFLKPVIDHIPTRVILNGEPMTERVEDLFGQFLMLDGGDALGHNITQFRQRYMKVSADGYGWEARRDALTDIQEATKHISHWLMNPKIKMPTREYSVVYVDMTDIQRDLDNTLHTLFAAELSGSKIEVKHAVSVFMKRLQLMGGVFRSSAPPFRPVDLSASGMYKSWQVDWKQVPTNKLAVVQKLIEQNPDTKIVIWHQYIPETALISDLLRRRNIHHLTYTDPEDSWPLTEFAKAKSGVLLIRASMCKGLNQLADADIALIYSNPLSYRSRSQLEGRSQRMTSKTMTTHVVDIVTKGGMDEVVYHMLQQKRDCALTLGALRDILNQNKS